MLRLVRQDLGEADTTRLDSNRLLRQALERITLGKSARTDPMILWDEDEAEALDRVLCHMAFTPDQLEEWVRRLRSDPPYARRRSPSAGSRHGLFHRLFGCWRTEEESVEAWRRRAERFIQEQIASVADRRLLEAPLARLEQARVEITCRTRKEQWTMIVMKWALVHLLVIPPHGAGASAPRATTG